VCARLGASDRSRAQLASMGRASPARGGAKVARDEAVPTSPLAVAENSFGFRRGGPSGTLMLAVEGVSPRSGPGRPWACPPASPRSHLTTTVPIIMAPSCRMQM
jgi:hypothetical protein